MDITTPKKSNLFMLFFLGYLIIATVFLAAFLWFSEDTMSTGELQMLFYGVAFLPPVVVYRIAAKKNFAELFPMRVLDITNIVLVLLISFAIMPVMMALSAISMLFSPNDVSDMITEMVTESNIFFNLFVIGILPAFLEEAIFRGIILRGYQGVRLLTVAFVNAIFFSVMHLSLQQLMYAFLLGFVFVLLVHYTKSLLSSIIAHFTINGTQMLLVTLSVNALQASPDLAEAAADETLTADMLLGMGLVGVVFLWITAALIFALIRHNKKDATLVREEIYGAAAVADDEHMLFENAAEANVIPGIDTGNSDLGADVALPTEETGDDYLTHARIPVLENRIFNWPFWTVTAVYLGLVVVIPYVLSPLLRALAE